MLIMFGIADPQHTPPLGPKSQNVRLRRPVSDLATHPPPWVLVEVIPIKCQGSKNNNDLWIQPKIQVLLGTRASLRKTRRFWWFFALCRTTLFCISSTRIPFWWSQNRVRKKKFQTGFIRRTDLRSIWRLPGPTLSTRKRRYSREMTQNRVPDRTLRFC